LKSNPFIGVEEILTKLEITRSSIDRLHASAQAGVYAIFLKNGDRLPIDTIPKNGLVYIGMSKNLAAREYDMHFCTGKSGFSTLRRTIGALKKEELNLVAIPRSKGGSQSNVRNFSFDLNGEERLTRWMRDNLEVGICPLDKGNEEAEKNIISELKPMLCLRGWPNPLTPYIKNLRKKCAEEAKLSRK